MKQSMTIKRYRMIPVLFALMLLISACGADQNVASDTSAQSDVAEAQSKPEPKTTESSLGPVHTLVTLDNPHPVLGQPIVLTLSVDAEPDVAVTMPEFGDQMSRFTIADFKTTENLRPDGRYEFTQSYRLDLPMSGKLNTPSFLVEFVDNRAESEQKSVVQEILTTPIVFEVQSVFADGDVPESLYPMQESLPELILPEGKQSKRWWWYAIAAACAMALLAGVMIKKHKRIRPALPPDIVALREIENLEKSEIPTDPEEIDQWYVHLSGIVRAYIEARFALNAPRLTTEEFFILAQKSDILNDEQQQLIHKLLEHSDRVKFTDFIPSRAESAEMIKLARLFVTQTRQIAEDGNNHA